jgi:hypothetical protein
MMRRAVEVDGGEVEWKNQRRRRRRRSRNLVKLRRVKNNEMIVR